MIFWHILLLCTVGIFAVIIFCIAQEIRSVRDVDDFFSKHYPLWGIVKEYQYKEAYSRTSLTPARMGSITVVQPIHHHTPASYKIVLECEDDDCHFLATFEIPPEEFEKEPIGGKIMVDMGWAPMGYEIIQNDIDH